MQTTHIQREIFREDMSLRIRGCNIANIANTECHRGIAHVQCIYSASQKQIDFVNHNNEHFRHFGHREWPKGGTVSPRHKVQKRVP